VAKKPRRKAAAGRGKRPPAGETAHAKRIRLYQQKHPGASRAQARGHKPAEHATRKERARAEKRLTENERAAIRRYARAQAKRAGRDADDFYRDMVAWTQREGGGRFKDFERMRRLRDRLAVKGPSDVRIRIRQGTAELIGDTRAQERNIADMDDFLDDYDVPDPEWLWYH
jgi:hypothetical protein